MKQRKRNPVRSRRRKRRPPSTSGNGTHDLRGQIVSTSELARLHERMRELTETVDALRSGAVDAVVVSGPNGNQIYSLTGAEQPYRLYVERMQEGAVTVSSEGIILYTNQRFADMLHLPLERVIGSDIRAHVGPENWLKLSDAFGRERGPVKHAAFLPRPGQPALPVTFSASGLDVDHQQMLCLVVTDLTSQHENTQLRVAKEIAESANLAKDEFLAALSHELRTPLTPALMSAVNLERDPLLPAHLRDEITVVRRNVELEARLIDDLLDLTRLSRGKLELRTSPIDLHRVLGDAIAICQPDVSAKQLELRIDAAAENAQTSGDAVRIEQVLWNILRNAVKFTPEGGTIVIRTRNPTPQSFAVEMVDTGIGFEMSIAEKLFQAFEQGGRHITRQFGGLGLGLAISRSIAEAHGGTIRASSAGPGRGAVFTLELPLRLPAPSALPRVPEQPPRIETAGGLRILLVEDHTDTRNVLERALRRNDHRILSAASARSALEIADRNEFDLVISDLGLPDLSGLELMRQLRDRFGLRGIAVSGYGMEQDVARSRSAGFVHHLTKPISVQHLRELIRDLDHGPAPH